MHQSPLTPFTLFHVALSLVGLISGLVFLLGLFYGRFLRGWTFTFLGFTIATSVTGFFFPFKGITPGIVLGVPDRSHPRDRRLPQTLDKDLHHHLRRRRVLQRPRLHRAVLPEALTAAHVRAQRH